MTGGLFVLLLLALAIAGNAAVRFWVARERTAMSRMVATDLVALLREHGL